MKFRLFGLLALLLVLAACTSPGPGAVTVVASPQPNAVDVEIDTVVTATFNVAMNESTLADSFSLSSKEGPVAGVQSYDAATRRLTFTPDEALDYGTQYTASVNRSVRSTAGGRLAGPATGVYSWAFTTIEGTVASVTVTPATATLVVGESQQFAAAVVADVGLADTVTWSSSDDAVATVDATGNVTAVAAGTATITATATADTGVYGTAEVTVIDPRVTVTPANQAALIGETVQFDAVAIDLESSDVIWESSDLAVATIDATGLATALSEGTTTITATSVADPSISGTAVLTVAVAPAVISITVTPSTEVLEIGDDLELLAVVAVAGGADDSVTWTSEDEAVATVDENGFVTAVADGATRITATSVVDVSVSGYADITVLPEGVNEVVVSPAELTLLVSDDPAQLNVDVDAISGAPDTVTWRSEDETVARVDQDGLVTAVAPGITDIVAQSDFDASIEGSATITVPGVTGLTVTPPTSNITTTGTVELLATPTRVVGDEDDSVTWESSDIAIATVDGDGLVTAVAPGTVIITAASVATPTVTATADVTVYSAVTADDYVTAAGYLEGQAIDIAAPVVNGGLAPYTFAQETGLLPTGVELGTDGSISGNATSTGTYSGTITVTDGLGQTDTAEYTIVIGELLEANLFTGWTGVVHMTEITPQSLIANGGIAPFTFEVVTVDPADSEWPERYALDGPWSSHPVEDQDPLPADLTVDETTGVLSGTVTAEPRFYRTYLRITDAIGQTDVVMTEIDIDAAPLVLEYDPATFEYTAGGAFEIPLDSITVTGGIGPYEFSYSRTSCSEDPCVDTPYWGIDPTNGVIERLLGGIEEEANGNRTYVVTVTDDDGETATFTVTINELEP